MFAFAAPAAAQSAPNWTGFYVGGRVGYVATPLDTRTRVLFDKNLDGHFGDTVTTAAGANAFSPGFCNGEPPTRAPADGCDSDNDGLDYAVHAGADYQFGSIVVGGLVEYGRSKAENSVTAFSTTPASYYADARDARHVRRPRPDRRRYPGHPALRHRGRGPRQDPQSSSAPSTPPTPSRSRMPASKQNGYRVGGGFETKVGPLALGALTCSPTSRTTTSAST